MPFDEDQTLQRYALALALIPDPTVAGDLFMDSWSEADLRRRAARWSRRHGCRVEPNPTVPVLTAAEREYGLHLARRGWKRRWTGALFSAFLAVAAGAAGFWLFAANRISGPLGTGRVVSAQVSATHGAIPTTHPEPLRSSNPQDLLAISRVISWLNHAKVQGPGSPCGFCASYALTLDLSGGRFVSVTPNADCTQLRQGTLIEIHCEPREGELVVSFGREKQPVRVLAPDLYRWLVHDGWKKDIREVPADAGRAVRGG